MKISRRQAMRAYGGSLAGMAFGLGAVTRPHGLLSQAQEWPDKLVEVKPREVAALPLNSDGSAPEHPPKEAGTITEPTIWRYTKNQAPQIEFDYRKMKLKVDPRGTARLSGTLGFSDLEPLPRHSYVVLLQCGATNPRGIVKWTGVRFSDFAKMLGVGPNAYYCRLVGSDNYYIEEDMKTLMHPQVMLAWLFNDEPIPPKHGAPLRLIIPFRYGARSLKAITEIQFTATSFAAPKAPPA